MLTRMTDEDWESVVQVFRACRSRRGDKGRNDRRFLEALHYFCIHNITWRALPEAFGPRTWFRCSTPPSCGRDALPKLQGVARYAETHPDAFRRIEAVAEVGDKL